MRRPPSEGISVIVANPVAGGTSPDVQRARSSALTPGDDAAGAADVPGPVGAWSSTQAPQPSDIAANANERTDGQGNPDDPGNPDLGQYQQDRIEDTPCVSDYPTPNANIFDEEMYATTHISQRAASV
jgi:hypothetical protein